VSAFLWSHVCPFDASPCERVGPPHLCQHAAVDDDAGAAVKVEAPAVAAALVGVHVHAARLGRGAPDQVYALVCTPSPRKDKEGVEQRDLRATARS
jgi:hypothetical protein